MIVSMVISPYLNAIGRDWLARMTGPLSLILLFVPRIAPDLTSKYLGGSLLVWIVAFICLIVSSYRAWLSEHRSRLAEKLDPLIEDVRLLREFWDKIRYDHKDSRLIDFPLSGFDVEKWEEVHKQLLRLLYRTSLHADRARWCFVALGIGECPRLADVMSDQTARRSLNALRYTKLLEEHAALLSCQRARIAG
jgi:hypothetical protein